PPRSFPYRTLTAGPRAMPSFTSTINVPACADTPGLRTARGGQILLGYRRGYEERGLRGSDVGSTRKVDTHHRGERRPRPGGGGGGRRRRCRGAPALLRTSAR